MNPSYPAARTAAARVQPHFAQHRAKAQSAGHHRLGPLPEITVIESIIEAAFWASLRREEDYRPIISLAFVPPDRTGALIFEHPLSLAPTSLTRLAPAVEQPGLHLGVWYAGENLAIWGVTRSIPELSFVLEVAAPGLLVIKHSRAEDSGKFLNIAVLEGDRIKVLDEHAADLPDCSALVGSLIGFASTAPAGDEVNVLMQVAVSMRVHRRGGSLLVVPGNSATWQASIVHPIRYPVSPSYSELAVLMRGERHEKRQPGWRHALDRAIETIGGLTAVDGATVITDRYELLAFGAKIGRRDGWGPVEQVLVTEPVEDASAAVVHPTELGGTRHLSAAQFAQDQRDAVALVASQDGRFTVFAWSHCDNLVQAHSVEALLF